MADAVNVPVQRRGAGKKEVIEVTQEHKVGDVEEKVNETSSDPDLPTGEGSAQSPVDEEGVRYVRGHPVIRNGESFQSSYPVCSVANPRKVLMCRTSSCRREMMATLP
jgi:hypothetical protein